MGDRACGLLPVRLKSSQRLLSAGSFQNIHMRTVALHVIFFSSISSMPHTRAAMRAGVYLAFCNTCRDGLA